MTNFSPNKHGFYKAILTLLIFFNTLRSDTADQNKTFVLGGTYLAASLFHLTVNSLTTLLQKEHSLVEPMKAG